MLQYVSLRRSLFWLFYFILSERYDIKVSTTFWNMPKNYWEIVLEDGGWITGILRNNTLCQRALILAGFWAFNFAGYETVFLWWFFRFFQFSSFFLDFLLLSSFFFPTSPRKIVFICAFFFPIFLHYPRGGVDRHLTAGILRYASPETDGGCQIS